MAVWVRGSKSGQRARNICADLSLEHTNARLYACGMGGARYLLRRMALRSLPPHHTRAAACCSTFATRRHCFPRQMAPCTLPASPSPLVRRGSSTGQHVDVGRSLTTTPAVQPAEGTGTSVDCQRSHRRGPQWDCRGRRRRRHENLRRQVIHGTRVRLGPSTCVHDVVNFWRFAPPESTSGELA